MKKVVLYILSIFALSSCASGNADYESYLAQKSVAANNRDSFSHCRGYGCRLIDRDVILSTKDWAEIDSLFAKPISDAKDERSRIAKAIGLFEKKVGSLTGTDADIAGTYKKLGNYQHDCVDESVNTTIYLDLLQKKNTLQFHTVDHPQSRVFPFSRALGPHQTAVIRETETRTRYAVDSWFHNNGHPAEIIELEKWFHGWRPDKAGRRNDE